MFTCICGKQFKTQQALNGHKGYCKEYLGKDKYLQVLKNNKDGQIKAKETLLKQSNIKKEQQLQQWISKKHKCEKCGKVMTEKYASGRFCCKECARGFSNYQGKDIERQNSINQFKYKCEICGNMYKNKLAFSQHLKLSHTEYYKLVKRVRSNTGLLDITEDELKQYRKNHIKCEICGKDIEDIKNENNHFNGLCIDHNHTTNEFRGLLCMTCNRSLGWFEKNEQNVISYLNNKGRERS